MVCSFAARTGLPIVASLAPAEPNYARQALISDFPGLAIRDWRLAISGGVRPVAFNVMWWRLATSRCFPGKGKTLVRQPDTTGAAPNKSRPPLANGYVRGDLRCT
jgi:hypothetical protein